MDGGRHDDHHQDQGDDEFGEAGRPPSDSRARMGRAQDQRLAQVREDDPVRQACEQRAGHLGRDVSRDHPPGESADRCQSRGDRRVEMGAGEPGHRVDRRDQAEGERGADREVIEGSGAR